MSLLTFLEITPVELICQGLLASIGLFLVAPIGYFFMEGIQTPASRQSLFTATTVGLTFLSFVSTIFLAFAPFLIKPLMGLAFIFSLPIRIFTHKDLRNFENQYYFFGKNIKAVILFWGLILLFFSCWLLAKTDVNVDGIAFNGHENYFSAIPLEIYRADYWGRLKIFDNYPFEWSKYHFFNGAITSFPLFFFWEKNLASFQLARIVICCLLIFTLIEAFQALFEARRSKLDKQIYFFALIFITLFATQVFSHQLWWTFFTNGFSSTALLLLFFASIVTKENVVLSMIFLAGFAISTVRSIIPAIFLFFAYFGHEFYIFGNGGRGVNKAKECAFGVKSLTLYAVKNSLGWLVNLKIRHKIYFYASIAAMAFSIVLGKSIENPFRNRNFILDFINDSWAVLLSPGINYPLFNTEINAFNPSPLMYLFWFLINLALSPFAEKVVIRGRIKLKTFLLAALIVTMFVVLYFVSKVFHPAIYLITLFVLFLSFSGQITKSLGFLLSAFVVASIMQLFIFDGQVSVANFLQLEWLAWFFVALRLGKLEFKRINVFSKTLIGFSIIGCFSYLYVASIPLSPFGLFRQNLKDENSIILPFKPGDHTASYYRELEPICQLSNPKISALASLGGAHSYFSESKTFNTSVSVAFVPRAHDKIEKVKDICGEK